AESAALHQRARDTASLAGETPVVLVRVQAMGKSEWDQGKPDGKSEQDHEQVRTWLHKGEHWRIHRRKNCRFHSSAERKPAAGWGRNDSEGLLHSKHD